MIRRLQQWRLPPIETYPSVVAFVQTWAGKLVLFIVFAALMKLISPRMWFEPRQMWLLMTVAAVVVSLSGRHRHLVLLISTGVLLAVAPSWIDFSAVHATMQREYQLGANSAWYLRAGTLLVCAPFAALAIVVARRYREHALGRRPVLVQHVLYFCLLGLAASRLMEGLAQVLLWSVMTTFSAYFWYLAYALMDQRRRHPAPFFLQLGTFGPFFAATVVPIGKGAANWRSVEAGTAEALAVTQLKALKLLVWAVLLKEALLPVFRWAVYDTLGAPTIRATFKTFLNGGDVPLIAGLLSIVANFPERLLIVAIGGHVVIAVIRLAGFRALRNTWRPLSSRTIAEFWNRYLYYFKEVLVDVYFYPTYLRWFKAHPRFRIAFATFVAAGLGNYFFHFMENYSIVKYGLVEALIRTQTYAFYCLALVAGIVISQLRARKPDPRAGWIRGQLVPSLGVAVFFCFLSVFDGPQGHVSLAQHFQFIFNVLGIDQWIKTIG